MPERRFPAAPMVDARRFELGQKIVRLKRTPEWLVNGVARVGRCLHPGGLVRAIVPKVLVRIDDDGHFPPTR